MFNIERQEEIIKILEKKKKNNGEQVIGVTLCESADNPQGLNIS